MESIQFRHEGAFPEKKILGKFEHELFLFLEVNVFTEKWMHIMWKQFFFCLLVTKQFCNCTNSNFLKQDTSLILDDMIRDKDLRETNYIKFLREEDLSNDEHFLDKISFISISFLYN